MTTVISLVLTHTYIHTYELGYNVLNVVITKKHTVNFNSEELIGATKCLTL